MDTELLILIFFFILSIITYVLLGYFIYLMVKNVPKHLKSRDREQYPSKKDFVEEYKNKELSKAFIVAVIGFYLIIIKKTLWLYFFPDSQLNIIFQDFRPYSVTIELIFTLLALSMIPSFFFIRKGFREKLKKVPIPLVLGISAVGPVYALLNNWFTGNLLFSAVLIIYGVLFAIITLKFR